MENLETRNKIIETAAEQFMRFGVRSVTMDDIARQAGMSKKTIYQEFADKNQLVYETFSASLEKDKCMMEILPKINDGIIEHLVGLSTYMRKRFADINPLVMNELQRYFPQCWQLFEDFKHSHIFKEVVNVLERGKEEGFFRPEINNEIIALLRLEQMMITFDPIKFPPSKYNMVDLQIEIFEHFLYGIFTEKGREAYLKQKNENQ
ncbi:TetR/AcrR family transcriptional regulator [Aquiflexum gelatinilyticum]|uniref:TetR/AcrR family transcriptional regulator n=1 Tax=Aquiflexum gelatinilyticum TaxID=2961943 RepID=A0A9X2SYH9_9BACT|nr:TetR/AcrR family transcriptional regulator [Aquiflexum gelatinilyticum]MCR9015377.1 TetR/AcrR family transcriptional regulator [Aquiflexum gelatinilyticum]MCS4435270.1 TetR/AcrR family transcriptional regulator [Aquiflexum gelatinilyticum]